ncbi:MAG: glycoside hydrolase family 71/99-like protein [Muribaculum sp.]|nr:glycoside hydrolase family 71/99-like protein [Muribaculum sp.]
MKRSLKRLTFVGLVSLLAATEVALAAGSKHETATKYPSYEGLIMAGYQGWFQKPSKGKWFESENQVRIDMWPDISEYENTYPTGLKHADGTEARFFSSDDKQTVNVHFKWMKDYGLDGVFMQRFWGSAKPSARKRNNVLRNALEAARENDRAIGVMYDLSGFNPSTDNCSMLIDDWKYLVDSLKVTNPGGDNTYVFYNGRPLVTIWGIGFPDRPYNIRNIGIEKFINFLKNDPEYGGCSVMIGVPTFWRDLNSDCVNDPYLHELIGMCDIVLPWMVQRFSPLLHNDMDRYRDVILGDIKWCNERGLGYVPVVTPGFSWHNLSRFEFPDDVKPAGSIPRQGGRFYWQQIFTALNSGAKMLYVAMFDEVNEGTAIFKCTDNPPVGKDIQFVGMDGMPSDHYLWLTGEAARMLRNEKPLTKTLPVRE